MLLALGVGSLFNHSGRPNLDYRIDSAQLLITYIAARNIQADEELTIFYGDKLWFIDTTSVERAPAASGVTDNNTSHDHMDDEHAFLGSMTI